MNFKKLYVNGHSELSMNVGFVKFRILPHMMWNDIMLWLTRITSKRKQNYHVIDYPYMPDKVERIESWYERRSPEYKRIQYTRSTFVMK
jgi:NAD-dependent SIR2 family protein deacetylase